jgi:hypothetical protein
MLVNTRHTSKARLAALLAAVPAGAGMARSEFMAGLANSIAPTDRYFTMRWPRSL